MDATDSMRATWATKVRADRRVRRGAMVVAWSLAETEAFFAEGFLGTDRALAAHAGLAIPTTKNSLVQLRALGYLACAVEAGDGRRARMVRPALRPADPEIAELAEAAAPMPPAQAEPVTQPEARSMDEAPVDRAGPDCRYGAEPEHVPAAPTVTERPREPAPDLDSTDSTDVFAIVEQAFVADQDGDAVTGDPARREVLPLWLWPPKAREKQARLRAEKALARHVKDGPWPPRCAHDYCGDRAGLFCADAEDMLCTDHRRYAAIPVELAEI